MFATPTPNESGLSSIGNTSLSTLSKWSAPNVATRRTEEILAEGTNFIVKSLNSPVPVQVQEVLRTDSRVGGVKLHESGWALLVAGSRLYLWRYSTNQITTKCYHLPLPASTIGWNADIITVAHAASASEVSLVGCSPEGCLCWWPNAIISPTVALQSTIDVGEGAVYSVISLPVKKSWCSVVTSSLNNIWVVNPPGRSQSDLLVRSLAAHRGSVFSGFGRRVSSLFFGSQSAEVQDVRRVVAYCDEHSKVTTLVLTSRNLQRWQISQSSEEIVSDVDVVSLLKDLVEVAGWLDVLSNISVLILDMQVCKKNTAILFKALNESSSEYGLVVFPVLSEPSPSNLKHLVKLNVKPVSDELCVLHGKNTMSGALVLTRNTVLLADVNDGSVGRPVSLPSSIVGVGAMRDQLLVFTALHGVVCISRTAPTDSQHLTAVPRLSTSMVAAPTSIALHKGAIAEESVAESAEILEKAFSQLYLEGDIAGAISLCDEHFSVASFSQGSNTLGDAAVLHLSQQILDDPPPPVAPSTDRQEDAQGKKSVIIIYHLQQKLEAHNKYVQFLFDVGLMDRITCVSHRGQQLPTRKLLCEHGELLQAAITLRKQHNNIADEVINLVISNRASKHSSLTRHDLFYTDVSLLCDFFPALIQHQRRSVRILKSPQEKVSLLVSASTLMDSMLRDAVFYRHQKSGLYDSSELFSAGVMQYYVPWTSDEDVRSSVTEQLDLLLDCGLVEAQEGQSYRSLWNSVISLTDTLFDGYKEQLNSFRLSSTPSNRVDDVKKMFQAHKTKYLDIMMNHDQFQAVKELAERYEDFRILVTLCQKSGNGSQLLSEYMSRYSDQGFSDFLFKQYLNEGHLNQLLSFSKEFPRELGSFLKSHSSLSWLHYITTQDYNNAQKTLKHLADQETKCVERKKTYLSLSKLTLLASEENSSDESALATINSMLQHIVVQEKLPAEAVEAAGFDYDIMPPLSPQRIIELYVGELNPASTEEHFLIALEYLQFSYAIMDDSTFKNEAAYIWSRAILKNNWMQLSTDDVLTELKTTFFFRLWNEFIDQGWSTPQLLPDLETLLACPLLIKEELHQDHTFLYFMKAAYELIERGQ